MAYSVQQFTSTGTEDHVILSFPYLDKADIHLYGNSVETAFVWVSANRIDFPPFPAGTEVVVRRLTNRDKVRYLLQEGAPFTREILDQIHTQALYLAQEAAEGVFFDMYGDIDMHGFRVRNAGAPQAPLDYTTKQWVESAIQDVNNDYGLRSVFDGPDQRGLDNLFGGGGWTGVDAASGNFYDNPNHTSRNALRQRWQIPQGEATDPVFWWQKTSSANVADGWEQGNQYNSLIKVGGTAFGCAGTDYVQYEGGSGDLIARHCRAHLNSAGAAGFALWAYTKVTNPLASRVAGAEISINNGAIQPSWIAEASGDPVGIGALTALNLGVADGSYGIHHAIRIPNKGASDLKRPWTGILMGQNSIMPVDANGNGEAIRLRGASFTSGRYGAIALGDDTGAQMFSYGIRAIHADFSSNAMLWVKLNHKIVWGDDKSGSSYIAWDSVLDCLRVGRTGVAVNNSKVLGGRITGVFAMTGSTSGASIDTETCTLPQLARYVKKVTDAMQTHGMIGPT